MNYSKHNIFSKIRESENYFIVNLLTGNADILNPAEARLIERIRNGEKDIADEAFVKEITEKGYFSSHSDEEKLFRTKYLDFIDHRENDEIQIFYVPDYSCNFSCSYCYQDQYANDKPENGLEVIDQFMSYIKKEFAGRKKYITVFGGEPLLPGLLQRTRIEYMVKKASEAGIPLCFVTNGFTLSEYVTILKEARIKEIQVTLDGTSEIHDKRRHLKGGGATFDKIVEGIDACLENSIPVNLRMVLDKENIDNLPELARFSEEKGWTSNPLFKTQLGRNYELHHCQQSNEKLFDRISLYEKVYEASQIEPAILKFHKPAYSVSRYLSENGSLPDPLFDSCPACKTEWAFDYTGNIFSCTATVGKKDESLGTFYPEKTLRSDIINEWESRDITSIPECKNCNLSLACGGGCGSVAKNRTGSICSTDCRPVKELLELGFSAYFEKK
jgi:uncharacterized protein